MHDDAFAAALPDRDDEPARPRRRGAARATRSRRHGRIRLVYFGLASLWGFAAGVAVLAIALELGGRDFRLDGTVALGLTGGLLLALVGGGIVAAAYREIVRRAS